MRDALDLRDLCARIDGRPYPAYRDLRGPWELSQGIRLMVDRVQGDPFAAPSRVRLRVQTDLGSGLTDDPVARLATEDWLLRRFGGRLGGQRRGSGRSGVLTVYQPGPEIVQRSALVIRPDGWVEVRLQVGLPAQGRRILGRQAEALLLEDLVAAGARLVEVEDSPELARWRQSVAAQRALRDQLEENGLVAFIGQGAILPRASGVDRAPLPDAVPFTAPEGMRCTLDTPMGPVSGMGIPRGITLVVGGGFHGKSTLLRAVQWGHLDHVPGDGRERVVALASTAKVRAEDGRVVHDVDISAFLGELPGGRGTRPLSTADASGSTSQAAAIIEALEAGARLLLMDEDTCATNLMVRDATMRALIPCGLEPITPLVERIRQLADDVGCSVLLVVGGVGDYLAVADTVVCMEAFEPRELTAEAHALAPTPPPVPGPWPSPLVRRVVPESLAPTGKGRVRARDGRRVEHGLEEIDLSAVEQVIDGAHARSLAHALRVLADMPGAPSVPALLVALRELIQAEGLDVLSPFESPVGDLVAPRSIEVAAALSRLRGAELRADEESA